MSCQFFAFAALPQSANMAPKRAADRAFVQQDFEDALRMVATSMEEGGIPDIPPIMTYQRVIGTDRDETAGQVVNRSGEWPTPVAQASAQLMLAGFGPVDDGFGPDDDANERWPFGPLALVHEGVAWESQLRHMLA